MFISTERMVRGTTARELSSARFISLLVCTFTIGALLSAAALSLPVRYAAKLNQQMRRGIWAIPTSSKNNSRWSSSLERINVIENCKELYHKQPVDHFAYHPEDSIESMTYMQRYFICSSSTWGGPGSPILFYAGNEADVTLYLNATGLMWENAKDFKALLIFAEHRYYGKSQPFAPFTAKKMDYLTSEQALADFSELITAVKKDLASEHSPVIAFGGSYGGMLAAWWRVKYPHIVDGAIAASAPVLDFEGDVVPPDVESFSEIVTRDASKEGGSSPSCAGNVRASWEIIWDFASTEAGLETLTDIFRLCSKLQAADDVWSLAYWIQSAFSYMAMGNYPYPSEYILNGRGELPAWPVRVACESLDFDVGTVSNRTLLERVRDAVSIYYNYSSNEPLECFDLHVGVNEESQIVEEHWSYQFCTEMFMPSSSDGVHDMWWPSPWDSYNQSELCFETWGIHPRINWISTYYGGIEQLRLASNIVFSNGKYDPWSGTGVLTSLSDSVVALILQEGAHHLDLFWSSPEDPDELVLVREIELQYISSWIKQAQIMRNNNPETSIA